MAKCPECKKKNPYKKFHYCSDCLYTRFKNGQTLGLDPHEGGVYKGFKQRHMQELEASFNDDIGKCLKCKTGDISQTKGMWCEKCSLCLDGYTAKINPTKITPVNPDDIHTPKEGEGKTVYCMSLGKMVIWGKTGGKIDLPIELEMELELVESRNK